MDCLIIFAENLKSGSDCKGSRQAGSAIKSLAFVGEP
jgi:hypothetical protein